MIWMLIIMSTAEALKHQGIQVSSNISLFDYSTVRDPVQVLWNLYFEIRTPNSQSGQNKCPHTLYKQGQKDVATCDKMENHWILLTFDMSLTSRAHNSRISILTPIKSAVEEIATLSLPQLTVNSIGYFHHFYIYNIWQVLLSRLTYNAA